jgi:hypothetical protein
MCEDNWRVDGKWRTIVLLYTHIFPEALFHCCAGFHVACPQVLAFFEELGLLPPAVDSLAILGDCWCGCWRGRTRDTYGVGSGGSGRGGVETLVDCALGVSWYGSVGCVE